MPWAVEQGITAGTSATTFSPNVSCTRAQMVTFLWRANGSPKATAANSFTDVSADSYYYDAVSYTHLHLYLSDWIEGADHENSAVYIIQ